MTEQELRQRVASTAMGWLGVKKGSPQHHTIVDIYNSHRPLARGYTLKYTDAWCSGFASAVAIAADMTDIIPTEVGCEEHIRRFQKMGRWVEDDTYLPQIGDYIFYDWQDGANYATTDNKGWADHVGIVTEVDGSTITVIEGNMGKESKVGTRTMTRGGRYIRGYGVPDYASKEDNPTVEDHWYDEAQRWAKKMGIADGTRPEDPATRAEVWAMMQRLYNSLAETGKER